MELDGYLLKTFLMILEESSVSKAAERLNVTQPAVSRSLAKLRDILGDVLFVRSGQGLVPTEHANGLREPVQKALDGLMGLTDQRQFDPLSESLHFKIAANDMQRELIFPKLLRETITEGVQLRMTFMPSGIPNVELLRDSRCHLVLTPLPPDAPDIYQKKVLTGQMMCFYDGEQRSAPKTWEEYCTSEHIGVRFARGRTSFEVMPGLDVSAIRKATVSVSNFNAIPAFVKGSNLVATELDLMSLGPLKHLDFETLPFDTEPISIYMVWHERSNTDPAHVWLRQKIERIASEIPSVPPIEGEGRASD
ncbi:MAG: LysR family transcriptional regulator [Paracoccaceae bacterium]